MSTEASPRRRGVQFAAAEPLPKAVTEGVEAVSNMRQLIATSEASERPESMARTRASGKRRRAQLRKQQRQRKQAGTRPAPKPSDTSGTNAANAPEETTAVPEDLLRSIALKNGMSTRQVRRHAARMAKKSGGRLPQLSKGQMQAAIQQLSATGLAGEAHSL